MIQTSTTGKSVIRKTLISPYKGYKDDEREIIGTVGTERGGTERMPQVPAMSNNTVDLVRKYYSTVQSIEIISEYQRSVKDEDFVKTRLADRLRSRQMQKRLAKVFTSLRSYCFRYLRDSFR